MATARNERDLDRGSRRPQPDSGAALLDGAGIDHIRPVERHEALAAAGLDSAYDYVIFLGRFGPWVDFDTILGGFAVAARQRPQVRLLLVGDGEESGVVDETIARLDIADRVVRTGFVADVGQVVNLLGCSRVALLATRAADRARTGVGAVKLAEYFAAGRPVVAVDLPGVREAVAGAGAGIVTPPDPDAYGTAIGELLDDSERAEALGAAGRRAALERRGWRDVASRTLPMLDGGGPSVTHKNWDNYVQEVEEIADSQGFLDLRDRIVALADPRPGEAAVDIGAGTGLLTFPLAERLERVWAVDISAEMCEYLKTKVSSAGYGNVEVALGSATSLPLPDGSVDLAVSNYCFHHLSDRGKRSALAEARRVLRPGGRLVFGDMMFRVSITDQRDRAVVIAKVRGMLRKGPAGVVRLARNAVRFAGRRWEQPVRASWWEGALERAGFEDIEIQVLHHEGGIARARRP